MGLLNLWKKKDLDLPAAQSLDDPRLTNDLPSINDDLPSIDGNVDGSNVQQFGGMQSLPPLDGQMQSDGSKSISFNVPTLDFSLPIADDLKESSNLPSLSASLPSMPALLQENSNNLGNTRNNNTGNTLGTGSSDIDDNLNRLFFNDESWKEPDWTNFEPYLPEDKIDEPTPEDFKGADLPNFEETEEKSSARTTLDTFADEPVLEPAEPFKKSSLGLRPVELFIRGQAYNKVFTELAQMNKALTKIDSQVGTYDEMLKREEPLLLMGKEEMEYLYRKLNQIDKKVFVPNA